MEISDRYQIVRALEVAGALKYNSTQLTVSKGLFTYNVITRGVCISLAVRKVGLTPRFHARTNTRITQLVGYPGPDLSAKLFFWTDIRVKMSWFAKRVFLVLTRISGSYQLKKCTDNASIIIIAAAVILVKSTAGHTIPDIMINGENTGSIFIICKIRSYC